MTVNWLIGDVREKLAELPDESVHCVVTSPPYFGLRDYGVAGQIGLEATPAAFVEVMVAVFREVRRVLRKDGTLWCNLGDSYAAVNRGENARPRVETLTGIQVGNPHADIRTRAEVIEGQKEARIKQKDLLGIPWMVAFALRNDGWYLRQDIIWSKPNPMPESVTDRCTKAHEYLFLLSKSARYHFDADAIAEVAISAGETRGGGLKVSKSNDYLPSGSAKQNLDCYGETPNTRNRRSVWEVATAPFSEAHFATFPPALIEPCIKAGCPARGTVLDPFGGAGTTGLVADRLQRNAILIELNPAYAAMGQKRIADDAGPLSALWAAE